MLTVLYLVLLVVLILSPVLLLYWIDRKQKARQQKRLLLQLGEAGREHRLSFSCQEIIGNRIFGLDGLQRKLLVVENLPGAEPQNMMVNLAEVSHCTLEKELRGAGDEPGIDAGLSTTVTSIVLWLARPGQKTLKIVFYASNDNLFQDAGQLEKKALQWEVLLSKLIVPHSLRA